MSQLLDRLFIRAGIECNGHDLRRTFSTLAIESGCDEFVIERLIRHKIPCTGDRYIKYSMSKLINALNTYSPIRLVTKTPSTIDRGVEKVDGGVSTSP